MEAFRLSVALSISLLMFLILIEVEYGEKNTAYHVFDVASRLREVGSPPVQINGKEEKMVSSPWSLHVFHRDGLLMGNVSYEQRLKERLERDSQRVKALNKRIERMLNGKKERIERKVRTADFGGDVISSLSEGDGEYLVRLGVGTPANMEYLIVDTGSDTTWVQCEPCSDCYDQVDPVFDPSLSSSYNTIPCDSQLCNELDTSGCDENGCTYEVSYEDDSYSMGHFVEETLTLGGTQVKNIPIGCGQDNYELFKGAGGLLGLGRGPLSFPTQLGSYGKTFSYCLVDRDSGDNATLRFGPAAVYDAGSIYTPLLTNPLATTFYYVSITSIIVGSLEVPLPETVSGFNASTGEGGIIVDSGTTITWLQEDSYEAFRDAFLAGTKDLPKAYEDEDEDEDEDSIFDTCYNLSGHQSVKLPVISFRFSNGVSLTLPTKNTLISMDSKGTFCLAFAPTSDSLSVIGSFQLQGIRVSFDTAKSLAGFAANQC